MELRKFMKKDFKKKLAFEHKVITKCIFSGLTIAQIAKKLNYSQSTVSNRMNSLFEKYSARTRFEFILSVFSDVINQNKQVNEQFGRKIQQLSEENERLTSVLSNIVKNMDDTKACRFWIKNGKELLSK